MTVKERAERATDKRFIHALLFQAMMRGEEGLTVDDTGLDQTGRNAWCVGIREFEHEVRPCDDVGSITKWIDKVHPLMGMKHAIGIWFDDARSIYVLDLCWMIQDKSDALRIAKEQEQDAIWHLKNKELIYV